MAGAAGAPSGRPSASPPFDPRVRNDEIDDLDEGVAFTGDARAMRRKLAPGLQRQYSSTSPRDSLGSPTDEDHLNSPVEMNLTPVQDDDDEAWYVPDKITSRSTEALSVDETTARLFIAGWTFDDAHTLAVLIHKQRYAHRRLRALMQEIAFRIPNLSAGFLKSPVTNTNIVKSLSASLTATAAEATSTVRRKLSGADRENSSSSASNAPGAGTPSPADSPSEEAKSRASGTASDAVRDTVSYLMPDTAFAVWFPSIAVTAYTPGIDKPSLHPSATGFLNAEGNLPLGYGTVGYAASGTEAASTTSSSEKLSPSQSKILEVKSTSDALSTLAAPPATGLLSAASATLAATHMDAAVSSGGSFSGLSPVASSPLSQLSSQSADISNYYAWNVVQTRVPRRELRRINSETLRMLQEHDDLDEMGAELLSLIPPQAKTGASHSAPDATTSESGKKHHLHRSHLVHGGDAARVRVDVFKAMRHGARFVRVGYNDFVPQVLRLSQDMRCIYWQAVPANSTMTCERKVALPLPDPSPDGSRALPLPLSPLLPSDTMEDTRDVCDSSDPRVRRIYYTFYKPPDDSKSRRRGVKPTISMGSLREAQHRLLFPGAKNQASPESSSATPSVDELTFEDIPYGRGPKSMLDPAALAADDDEKFRFCRRIPIESITGISTFVTHDPRFQNIRGKMPLTYGMIIYYELPETVDEYAEEQKLQQHILNTQPHLREYVTKAADITAEAVKKAATKPTSDSDDEASHAESLASPSIKPVYEGSTLEFTHLSTPDQPGAGVSIDDQVAAPIGSRPIQLKVIRKSIALIALDGNEYHVWLKGLAMLRSFFNAAPPEVISTFSSKVVWATIERKWPSNLYLMDIESGVSMDRAFDTLDVLHTAQSGDGPRCLPPATLKPPAPSSKVLLLPTVSSTGVEKYPTEERPSMLLTRPQLELLLGQACKKAGLLSWRRSFLMTSDGADLSLLLRRVANHTYSFIIIRDSSYRVFGGFASAKWVPGLGYYGNSDSFVFRFVNPDPEDKRHNENSRLEVYQWAGQIHYYQVTDDQGIGFGGGGGTALHIDRVLRYGKSEWSGTYQNPVLAGSETFTIYEVEVWVGVAD